MHRVEDRVVLRLALEACQRRERADRQHLEIRQLPLVHRELREIACLVGELVAVTFRYEQVDERSAVRRDRLGGLGLHGGVSIAATIRPQTLGRTAPFGVRAYTSRTDGETSLCPEPSYPTRPSATSTNGSNAHIHERSFAGRSPSPASSRSPSRLRSRPRARA